ncbi:MAG TPA: hypothetical protein VGI95_05840 [Caulobacteraceae bacterium]
MKLNPTQIAAVLGQPKPEAETPTTPQGHALAEIDALNQRVTDHIETQRQPGESHEQAAARCYAENPSLYAGQSAAIDDIKNRHLGVQGAARPLGADRSAY